MRHVTIFNKAKSVYTFIDLNWALKVLLVHSSLYFQNVPILNFYYLNVFTVNTFKYKSHLKWY